METERLVLREFTPADAAFVLRLLNDPGFLRHIGDKQVRTLDDAVAYLERGPMASYRAHGFGLWLVADRVALVPLGMCGLLRREVLDDVDLGYAFLPESGGRGFAREAATAVVEHAAQGLGLRRLVAVVAPDNPRSIHLLTRLEFAYERMVRLAPAERQLQLFGRGL